MFSEAQPYRVPHQLRRLLLKLALHCHSVPSQLVIRDGEWSTIQNRGGGAFADIYEGQYKGERVAVKRLRVFQMTDNTTRAQILNVRVYICFLSRGRTHSITLSSPYIMNLYFGVTYLTNIFSLSSELRRIFSTSRYA